MLNEIINHASVFILYDENSLGCKVGTCCPSRSSLSICSSVVLPALSRPRNTNLPDFLYSPKRIRTFFFRIGLKGHDI